MPPILYSYSNKLTEWIANTKSTNDITLLLNSNVDFSHFAAFPFCLNSEVGNMKNNFFLLTVAFIPLNFCSNSGFFQNWYHFNSITVSSNFARLLQNRFSALDSPRVVHFNLGNIRRVTPKTIRLSTFSRPFPAFCATDGEKRSAFHVSSTRRRQNCAGGKQCMYYTAIPAGGIDLVSSFFIFQHSNKEGYYREFYNWKN